MKILFCGSRNWTDRETIRHVLQKLAEDVGEGPAIAVHGAARGADTIAGEFASELGFEVRACPANWEKHGKAAGPIRNTEMLEKEKPDRVIAFVLPESKGTWDMIMKAVKVGIPTTLHFGASLSVQTDPPMDDRPTIAITLNALLPPHRGGLG